MEASVEWVEVAELLEGRFMVTELRMLLCNGFVFGLM